MNGINRVPTSCLLGVGHWIHFILFLMIVTKVILKLQFRKSFVSLVKRFIESILLTFIQNFILYLIFVKKKKKVITFSEN